MKNYIWAKGYTYAKVPVFFRHWDILGFSITIQSHKTKRRRQGAMITKKEIWEKYEDLLKV
jgi:hypothetical protein